MYLNNRPTFMRLIFIAVSRDAPFSFHSVCDFVFRLSSLSLSRCLLIPWMRFFSLRYRGSHFTFFVVSEHISAFAADDDHEVDCVVKVNRRPKKKTNVCLCRSLLAVTFHFNKALHLIRARCEKHILLSPPFPLVCTLTRLKVKKLEFV